MSRDTLSLVDGEDGKTAYCPAFMSDRKALARAIAATRNPASSRSRVR
jgi:hypothetical protein